MTQTLNTLNTASKGELHKLALCAPALVTILSMEGKTMTALKTKEVGGITVEIEEVIEFETLGYDLREAIMQNKDQRETYNYFKYSAAGKLRIFEKDVVFTFTTKSGEIYFTVDVKGDMIFHKWEMGCSLHSGGAGIVILDLENKKIEITTKIYKRDSLRKKILWTT